MNIDIRLSTDFFTHPKIKMLQKRLGPKGILCLQKLWIWAAQTRPDGALGAQTSEYISMAADWTGDPDKFVDALIELHLLDVAPDGYVFLHNWEKRQPYAAGAQERRVKAQQAAEEKQAEISDKRREAANRRWEKGRGESRTQSQDPVNHDMQTGCKIDANENLHMQTGMQTENLHMQNDANGCKPMHPNTITITRTKDLDPPLPPLWGGDARTHDGAREGERQAETSLPESEIPMPEDKPSETPQLQAEQKARKKGTRKKTDLRPDDFEAVWRAYPARPNDPDGGKGSKEAARKAWDKLCRNGELPDLDSLLATLDWQKKTPKWRDGYIENCHRYLAEGHWKLEKPARTRPSYAPDERGRTRYVREDEMDWENYPKMPDGSPDWEAMIEASGGY